MYVGFYSDVAEEDAGEGSENVTVRWLIDEKVGAENFVMRYFTVRRRGYTPLHSHPWEHEVFVVRGEGYVYDGREKRRLKPGSFVYVPPGELHQFINEDSESLELLCLIPLKGRGGR